MARIGLLVLGIVLLLIGGSDLLRVSREQQPKTMSCERFIHERPETGWLRLGNCDIDYVGAGYRENLRGRIGELFFPVRPAGRRGGPVTIIAATRDPAALDVAQQTIGGGRQPDQEQFLVMMLKIVTSLRASREIVGYARQGLLARMQARRLVSGLGVPVAESFVVIDLYGRPPRLVPAIEAGAGGAALVAALLLHRRRRRSRQRPAVTAAAPGVAAPGTQQPSTYRGLMLLNLPPTATAAMIENAPPLGAREQVVQKLRAALPGVAPDERSRCVFSRPDCSVTVDLGRDEPVATAVVDAEGIGALAVLRHMLETTGWRIFVPRRGAFFDPDHLDAS